MFFLLITALCSADAVTLTGSSEYAVPGSKFTLTCDVPDEANAVTFYRRPELTRPVGGIQVASDQCYNVITSPAGLCTSDVCSCVPTSTGGRGTVFRWIIQPQTGDHASAWFCRRTNVDLPDQQLDSSDYTLKIADGPGNSISLSPSFTSYNRTEGDTLPDITCTADCRPGCTFVWTRPDNTNFTASAVLSLGQLYRSEQGTYRCTARNVVGESSTAVNITVIVWNSQGYIEIVDRPYIVLSPSTDPFVVVEGQTGVTLQCAATPIYPPVTSISWTKESMTVSSTGIYSLPTITPGHAGMYVCSATNSIGTTTGNITLNVIAMPRAPTIFGITNVSSSSLTLKWTPDYQLHGANTFTITYSCVHCDVADLMPVDIENTEDIQFTTLTDLKKHTQYCVNITATNVIGASSSAELIAVTAPGIITVRCASQESNASTSTSVIVVGAILIVVAVIGFGISLFVYRKGRLLCRSASQQGNMQKPVTFSNVLQTENDAIPAHAEERSHYQELNPQDIGKPSHYACTTEVEAGTSDSERGHYQELDRDDIETPSPYEINAKGDTGMDNKATSRNKYESGHGLAERHDYTNVTGERK